MNDTPSRFDHDAQDQADHAGQADRMDQPGLAIRRHHDRCFHAVEEVVPGGYIVQGIFIDQDEVAQVRKEGDTDNGDTGGTGGGCRRVL